MGVFPRQEANRVMVKAKTLQPVALGSLAQLWPWPVLWPAGFTYHPCNSDAWAVEWGYLPQVVPVRMERVICCQYLEEGFACRYYRLSVISLTILLPGKFPSLTPGSVEHCRATQQRLSWPGYARCTVPFLSMSSNTDQIREESSTGKQRHQRIPIWQAQTKTKGVMWTPAIYSEEFRQYPALLYLMSSWHPKMPLIQEDNSWHIRFCSHATSGWLFAKPPSASSLNSQNKKRMGIKMFTSIRL